MNNQPNSSNAVLKRLFSMILAFAIVSTVIFANPIDAQAKDSSNPYERWISVFDPEYYLSHNANAKEYAGDDINKLWTYFISIGIPNGEQASEEFNVQVYKKNYTVLASTYGNNMIQYYIHYATIGKAMGLDAKNILSYTDQKYPVINIFDPSIIAYDPAAIEFLEQLNVQNNYISIIEVPYNVQVFNQIYRYVLNNDLRSYDLFNGSRGLSFDKFTYTNTKETIVNTKITYYDDANETAAVRDYIANIAPSLEGKTTYETVKNVHDFICNTCDYDYDVFNIMESGGRNFKYGAYECLFEHKAVCGGYAMAFQEFMDYYEIPCYIATGSYNGSGYHAWNIVNVDGGWYHIDTTWDGSGKNTTYSYFLLGADKCAYVNWGNVYSGIITLANKSYKK